MNPDRSNYEIWFIDWLDGKLDDRQTELLQTFLGNNPDLRDELDTLALLNLRKPPGSYPGKELLKKTCSDLPQSQFEYLCVADLENDLSPEQAEDLRNSIGDDHEKIKTYKLIHKTKLIPGNYSYKHKNNLRKITPYQKVIRISFIGLSAAAAAVALFIIINLFPPEDIIIENQQIPQDITENSPAVNANPEVLPENNIIRENIISDRSQPEKVTLQTSDIAPKTITVSQDINGQADSLLERPDVSVITAPTIAFLSGMSFTDKYHINRSLIAFNTDISLPYDDGRSNVEKFISKFFHEKILKDKSAADKPVKGYEIAEAGITGLNKLFGTELALYRNTDENGEVTSVYFSSKFLKFNAPVKKSEPLP
jgi:hypothetical protein